MKRKGMSFALIIILVIAIYAANSVAASNAWGVST